MTFKRFSFFLSVGLIALLVVSVVDALALDTGQCLLSSGYTPSIKLQGGGLDEGFLDRVVKLFLGFFVKLFHLVVKVICAMINELGVSCKG